MASSPLMFRLTYGRPTSAVSAEAEEAQRQAAGQLICAARDHQKRVDQAERAAGQPGGQDRQAEIAGIRGDLEAKAGAHDHAALGAEICHA